jgi:hypothetical protein
MSTTVQSYSSALLELLRDFVFIYPILLLQPLFYLNVELVIIWFKILKILIPEEVI